MLPPCGSFTVYPGEALTADDFAVLFLDERPWDEEIPAFGGGQGYHARDDIERPWLFVGQVHNVTQELPGHGEVIDEFLVHLLFFGTARDFLTYGREVLQMVPGHVIDVDVVAGLVDDLAVLKRENPRKAPVAAGLAPVVPDERAGNQEVLSFGTAQGDGF